MYIRKILLISSILILLTGFHGVNASAAARDLTSGASLTLTDRDGAEEAVESAKLLDNKYSTYTTLRAGETLKVSSSDKIASLYIVWNKIPGEWTLTAGNTEYTLGKNGFLHEYADIEAISGTAVSEVSIKVSTDISICDVNIFTGGELPAWVQTWDPPCEKADIMLMSTHSDDEHLFFAGLLPY